MHTGMHTVSSRIDAAGDMQHGRRKVKGDGQCEGLCIQISACVCVVCTGDI